MIKIQDNEVRKYNYCPNFGLEEELKTYGYNDDELNAVIDNFNYKE